MAKKKPINGVAKIPDPEAVTAEPVLDESPTPEVVSDAVRGSELVPYGNGQWAAADFTRDLMVWVGGVRYEHVAETPDGRWVYAKS